MKRIIQFLLFVVVIILVYMLFLSIKQGMNKVQVDDFPIIEQIEDEDTTP